MRRVRRRAGLPCLPLGVLLVEASLRVPVTGGSGQVRRAEREPRRNAAPARRCYLPGGQCGLPLPFAPRHWLSPGPGASAHAAGAETASALIASTKATTLLRLLTLCPLPPTAQVVNVMNLTRHLQKRNTAFAVHEQTSKRLVVRGARRDRAPADGARRVRPLVVFASETGMRRRNGGLWSGATSTGRRASCVSSATKRSAVRRRTARPHAAVAACHFRGGRVYGHLATGAEDTARTKLDAYARRLRPRVGREWRLREATGNVKTRRFQRVSIERAMGLEPTTLSLGS